MNFYPKDTKDTEGLTINNLNKFLVRYFEDQALSGLIPVFTRTRAQFRLVLVKTGIRPLLTPALRLGLVGTRHAGALALMAQQHGVVHVIYCQSQRFVLGNNNFFFATLWLINIYIWLHQTLMKNIWRLPWNWLRKGGER